jgi:putative redox protein
MTTARATWVKDKQFVGETGSGHAVVLDASAQAGGANTGPAPMELLLLGQAGCTGIDVVYILRERMKKDVIGLVVEVNGTRASEEPRVYTDIEVMYRVRGRDIAEKDVARAIELSESKYCSASIMLGKTARIRSRYVIQDDNTGHRVTGSVTENAP